MRCCARAYSPTPVDYVRESDLGLVILCSRSGSRPFAAVGDQPEGANITSVGCDCQSRYVGLMDPSLLNSVVLLAAFSAIFFYVLYGVVKAAVREGMKQAWKYRADQSE